MDFRVQRRILPIVKSIGVESAHGCAPLSLIRFCRRRADWTLPREIEAQTRLEDEEEEKEEELEERMSPSSMARDRLESSAFVEFGAKICLA